MTLYPSLPEDIAAFARRLRNGEVLVLPTETVYGLAGDATNAEAVARIYEIKGRPSFNPLICHVASLRSAKHYGVFNATADKLARAFWPGALTLVVPRKEKCEICDLVSAGLPSLALRVPAHDKMQAVLTKLRRPLAAPSANPSGALSPSRPEDVRRALPDLDVLDGGYCEVGMESTIVGCLGDMAVLLRVGGIAREEIEAVLGEPLVNVPEGNEDEARLAPGRLVRHYAPRAALRMNVSSQEKDDLVLVGFGDCDGAFNLSASGDLREATANLFSCLHEADALAQKQGKAIGVAPIPTHGLGEAINDRLKRACD